MSPRRPEILSLEWDVDNEEHILGHILPDLVDEMIDAGTWYWLPNTSGHPPERVKIVGRTESGDFVTAILSPSATMIRGIWRPITAWHSSEFERRQYRQLKRQGVR